MPSPTPPTTSVAKQIARSASVIAVAMVVGQIVGLAAKSLVGSTFGTGPENEAFFAANRFSEIIFNLMAGGALGSAFIPTFTGLLAHEERSSAWKLASGIANLLVMLMSAAAVLSAIFAPQIVRYLLAPGFASTSPETEALTITLLRMQLPSAVIFGLSGLVMGILNAHRRFLLPALAPALYQVGWIVGAVLLAPRLGITGMAWGVVIGSLLHLLVQLPALPGLPQARYTLTLGRGMPLGGQVFRLMGPRLISVAVVQLNFLLNTTLASLQPAGSLTGISLAFPLMIMPQAAIAQSVAIAALPTFSAQAATGQRAEMRAALAAILRGVLLLAVPASVGLVLLRRPIVALIYQRGAFTAASTELVAWALLFYGLGLVGHSLVEIVTRAFFALQDTRTPTLLTTLAMVFNLIFSLLFSLLFSRLGWMPHGGLALANSLATALEAAGLLVLMRRRLEGLDGARSWRAAAQAGLAALGMGLALALWLTLTSGVHSAVVALGGVAVGAGVYFAVLLLLRVPEAQWIVSLAARRLR